MHTNRPVKIVIAISALIMGLLIIIMACDGYGIGCPIDAEITGVFGDYIGGVIGTLFSGAAFWLLYLTLKQQNDITIKENFDNQFTKMLLINQQNIDGMSFDATHLLPNADKIYIAPVIYKGKDVFQLFFYQFCTCRSEISRLLLKTDKIYTAEYENQIKEMPVVKERNINIYTLARLDICYSIVFYGINSEGLEILRQLFKNRYKESLIEKILRFLALKPAFDKNVNRKWKKLQTFTSNHNLIEHINDIYDWREKQTHLNYNPKFPEISLGYRSNFVKYYGGFHQLLGHYYRHLYQIVKHVDSSSVINDNEKYNLLKLIRGQMSNYEQIVFFLNSISKMGQSWEFAPVDNLPHPNLITHYRIIKNIPAKRLFGILVPDFYPNIKYEMFE